MVKPDKAKSKAATDSKQGVLRWVLRSSPPKTKAAMPRELPALPEKKPKVRKLFHSVTSTRSQPDISEEASRALEVNAIVHGMIDKVVRDYEDEESNRKLEVRSWLNSAVDWVVVNFKPDKKEAFATLKPKRTAYTSRQKQAVVEAFQSCEETTKSKKIDRLHLVPGYESVTRKMVEEWTKAGPARKRGPKVNDEYERHVISQLIYTEMENVENVETAVVKANVAHSHAVIKRAGEIVQKWPAFAQDARVKALRFSPM